MLSAAQSHQLAGETEDEDRTPHGLFTWALVKTLRSMQIDESADRMFLSLRGLMQSAQGGQEPDFSTTPERRRASLFGVRNRSLSGATIVAVESIDDGTVTLQGGLAAGIRAGAELRATGDPAESAPTLRVIDAQGMARSRAAVTQGSVHTIRPGMLFEVVRWTAPSSPALRVWLGAVVTPVTSALRERLGAGTRNDAIEVLSSPASADYVLVGRQRESIAEHAWERPLLGLALNASALPARTDWVAVDPARSAAAGEALAQQAVRLGVIRSWLQLESPADPEPFPYHLALRNTATGYVKTTGTVRDGESYELVLLYDEAMARSTVRSRYVYVVAFDSSGKSVVLFPSANGGAGENYLPPREETGRPPTEAIRLGRDRYAIGAPFGVDTYVMLATAGALPDPTVLEGEAVRTRGGRAGPGDALTLLLLQTGSATRGVQQATPTYWMIERLTIESVPAQKQ